MGNLHESEDEVVSVRVSLGVSGGGSEIGASGSSSIFEIIVPTGGHSPAISVTDATSESIANTDILIGGVNGNSPS